MPELTIEEQCNAKKCGTDVYCKPLLESLNDNNSNKKGFCNLQLLLKENCVIWVTTPFYKNSAKEPYQFVEWCPFCGTHMAPICKAREAKAKAKPATS